MQSSYPTRYVTSDCCRGLSYLSSVCDLLCLHITATPLGWTWIWTRLIGHVTKFRVMFTQTKLHWLRFVVQQAVQQLGLRRKSQADNKYTTSRSSGHHVWAFWHSRCSRPKFVCRWTHSAPTVEMYSHVFQLSHRNNCGVARCYCDSTAFLYYFSV